MTILNFYKNHVNIATDDANSNVYINRDEKTITIDDIILTGEQVKQFQNFINQIQL